MSPTLFRHRGYRAFLFSREEARVHVHIECADGEAKFWLEPILALADHTAGLSGRQLRERQTLIEERRDAIQEAWKTHFHTRR